MYSIVYIFSLASLCISSAILATTQAPYSSAVEEQTCRELAQKTNAEILTNNAPKADQIISNHFLNYIHACLEEFLVKAPILAQNSELKTIVLDRVSEVEAHIKEHGHDTLESYPYVSQKVQELKQALQTKQQPNN
jgi:hypothetical protein